MRILHVVSVIYLVNIGVLSQTPFHQQTCIVNVELSQKLENEGFHRIITYDIAFPADGQDDEQFYNGCDISLHQPLPAGLYVNNDELLELRAMKKLSSGVMNPVNIELPAEEASPIDVYVMAPIVDSNVSLRVPVHARYHSAKPGVCGAERACETGSGFARNTIETPHMFIRCPDKRVNIEDAKPCEKDAEMDFFKNKHRFKPLPYNKLTQRIHWHVPIGDTDSYNLVATVTVCTICLGSVYLLLSLHEYKVKNLREKHD